MVMAMHRAITRLDLGFLSGWFGLGLKLHLNLV
jgi:hypothetical protein